MTGKTISLEELFNNATEDISTFDWAVDCLADNCPAYTYAEILLYAVSNRVRARAAIADIETIKEQVPSDDLRFFSKLKGKLEEAESRFSRLINDPSFSDQSLSLFSNHGDMKLRVEVLFDVLKKIRDMAEDNMLLCDNEDDWDSVELREEAHDFVLAFADIYHLADFAKKYSENELIEEWLNRFGELEELFKEYFHYFQPVSDLLETIARREYYPELWWLVETPEKGQDEEELVEQFLNAYRPLYSSTACLAPDCPVLETSIAYALNELTGEERHKAESHVNTCPVCNAAVIDIRSAETSVGEGTEIDNEIDPDLLAIINDPDLFINDKMPVGNGFIPPEPRHILPSINCIPGLEHVMAPAGIEPRVLPMAAETGEERDARSFFAKLVEKGHVGSEVKELVKFKILNERYSEQVLTLALEAPEKYCKGKEYSLHFCWVEENGKITWPYPDIKIDAENGLVLLTFHFYKDDKPDGELRGAIIKKQEE